MVSLMGGLFWPAPLYSSVYHASELSAISTFLKPFLKAGGWTRSAVAMMLG